MGISNKRQRTLNLKCLRVSTIEQFNNDDDNDYNNNSNLICSCTDYTSPTQLVDLRVVCPPTLRMCVYFAVSFASRRLEITRSLGRFCGRHFPSLCCSGPKSCGFLRNRPQAPVVQRADSTIHWISTINLLSYQAGIY